MLRRWKKQVGIVVASLLVLSMTGCAESGGSEIPYPNLTDIKRIKDKLLTKEEQDTAIEDLSFEQINHRGQAIADIEKR